MVRLAKTLRTVQIVLSLFLAVTAFAGGIQLLVGFYAPPLELLSGSIFHDYKIPALALGIIVGGSGLYAAVLLLRKNRFASLACMAAGLVIMTFEFVELLAIGFPVGPAGFMQIFYFALGAVLIGISLVRGYLDLASAKG